MLPGPREDTVAMLVCGIRPFLSAPLCDRTASLWLYLSKVIHSRRRIECNVGSWIHEYGSYARGWRREQKS